MVTLDRRRSPWSPIRPDRHFPALPRTPGLDGLLALAVMAVIAFHLNPAWLPGGFFGIDLFFVVSGYLVTSLLVSEFGRSGDIALKRFWLARARRLLPSLVVLLGAVIVVSCLIARDALPGLRAEVPFSLLYVVNWWLIVRKVSAFASVGRPPLLIHLWVLSVVEQFYLLWPPLLLFLLRRVSPRLVVAVTLIGAAASSWWMGTLYHRGLDPSRAYLGTASHAQGLLIGCALSILVPPWLPRVEIARSARHLLAVVGVAALAGLVSLMAAVAHSAAFAYPVGVVLADLCAAVLIVLVVHPATWLTRAASLAPLRWVGTRAYALYLWHWPIIQLTRPDQDVALAGWRLLVFRLLLMAVAAELSHRLIGIPFAKPAVWAGWRRWFRTGAGGRIWAGLSSAVVAGLGTLLVVVPGSISPIGSVAAGAPATGRSRSAIRSAQTSAVSRAPARPAPSTTLPTPPTTLPAPTTAPPTTAPPTTAPPTTLPPAAAALAAKEPILAVGDSVMLSATRALTATFGTEIRVDAAIGREVTQGITRLEEYRASGLLAHYRTVVIALGTETELTPALFNELATVLRGVPTVIFYNTYDTNSWEPATNATLAGGVPAHPGMVEINWAATARGPGIVSSGGSRLTPAGATAFASLLNTTLLL
ncbi:MAG: acyltransferase [Acidimicrobiaceae bacterium]|nr:acyltransferase [Acidimicrobiaceae bacterium]